MHSTLSYILVAGVGLLVAHLISRPAELRSLRLSQLIFVPACFIGAFYLMSPEEGIGELMGFLVVLGFLIILLTPNIAYLCGTGLSNFLDPQDWTSEEEEIALRPIQRLIDKQQFGQALNDLDELLKTHRPTYEAVFMKARLLHQLGSVDETVATLLSALRLSKSAAQQTAVMETLDFMGADIEDASQPIVAGIRHVEIHHELVLCQMDNANDLDRPPVTREIFPGAYRVEETIHRNRRWLKLAGEHWGNAEICWEAMAEPEAIASQTNGFLRVIARLHQTVTKAVTRKPPRQKQNEAKDLYRQASLLIRHNEWGKAAPLLQRAAEYFPDHFEIAYRWVQAVRLTAGDDDTERAVSQALSRSRWTEHEEEMIRALRKPVS
jgi:tetratricopeptide (TPR) repeat protein